MDTSTVLINSGLICNLHMTFGNAERRAWTKTALNRYSETHVTKLKLKSQTWLKLQVLQFFGPTDKLSFLIQQYSRNYNADVLK